MTGCETATSECHLGTQHIRHSRLVLIEWLDSKGITTAWEYLDEVEPMPPTLCYSVGFLVADTDQYVTVAQAMSDNQVLGRTTIPKCSIQKMETLKLCP